MIGKKVLLVDDDPEFIVLTTLAFKKVGAQVFTAYNGMEGIRKVAAHDPDLILLDIMMPGIDGFDVCQMIRQYSNSPLIMLTALNQDSDMLKGLNAGADGFLSKPINWDILMARIRAVMRRNGHSNGSQTAFDYDDGYLKINIEKHRILIGDEPVKLTPVEFRLLVYLVNNAGRVLTFSEILGHAWGNEYKGYNDFVHVYISHLRRKIEVDAKNSRYFLSVHGVGYIFEPQDFKLIVSDDNDKKLLSLYNDVGS